MATLANIYGRFFERSPEQTAHRRVDNASIRVPVFANEDVYFFVKRIDNNGITREADPVAGGTCWKLIGSVVAAVVLLVAVLLPSAYGLLAGYQIQSLRDEGKRLDIAVSSLELEEAQLVSPARMEELAREQMFIDPPSQNVVYLDGKSGSLALNHNK
jgi:hypothetical protein